MTSPRRKARWSWQLGKLFGIAIRVHITLILFLVWIAFASSAREQGVAKAIVDWLLVLAVFAVIVVHELAHALVARRFGCATSEIVLLPIGGVSVMDRLPQRPRQELLVAVAGPAVNVVLALVLAMAISVLGLSFGPEQPTTLGAVLVQLLWINVGLALFNLLPAFPMDGGRVLRAGLSLRVGRERATRIAVSIGKVLAAVLVVGGLAFDPMLVLIGAFVWFAAQQESSMVMLASILSKATVGDAMIRTRRSVEVDESIDQAADAMLADGQRALAVTDHGRLTGLVTAADLASPLAIPGPHGAVGSVMHRDIPVLAPSTPLTAVMDSLERGGAALVVENDVLIGMLTTDQLAAFAALHARP
jgi:Zn-dependent protease